MASHNGRFLVLGRANNYYSDLLRWKRLPYTGTKGVLQHRILRHIERREVNALCREKRTARRGIATLLARHFVPKGPACAIRDFLRPRRTSADFCRTFGYVFNRNRLETSFECRRLQDGKWSAEPSTVFIVGQGVDSDEDRIRGYVTLVDVDTGALEHRVDVRTVSLAVKSREDYQNLPELLYYASASANAYEERLFLKGEMDFLECEEVLLAQVCETLASGGSI